MALFRLERENQVKTVAMNDVQFCDFSQTTNSIGTRDLKGCHVVIIYSSRGAILAHIAPGPGADQPRDSESMKDHIRLNMRTLVAVYQANSSFFPDPGTETHTIHAWLGGSIALPEHQVLIEQILVAMGLPRPTSHKYHVDLQAMVSPDSSTGTVVLLGSSPPRLLVEDNIVAPPGQILTSSAALSHTQGASSSSSATPQGVPNDFTGWVFVGASYVAFRDGVIIGRRSTIPPNASVYNPLGWNGTAQSWARWDGDSTHSIVYR